MSVRKHLHPLVVLMIECLTACVAASELVVMYTTDSDEHQLNHL